MSPDTENLKAAPVGLRKCDNPKCGRGPQDGRNLKRCAACSGAMYCSKECQKAAWPTHRDYCQRINRDADLLGSLDHEMKQFGFESTTAFSQALHEYTEAHEWACHNLVQAHVLLASGSSCSIARQEPRKDVLRIRLACQTTPTTPRSKRDPAAAFKVMEHGFWPVAYYATRQERNVRVIGEMLKAARDCHETNLRSPTINAYYYAGVVPIMYIVDGISVQQFSMFPMFRPPNNINIDAKVRTILGDLTRFCAHTMSTPFALRPVSERLPYYAVPGRYSRTKGKQWTWEALFSDWKDYHDGRAGCGRLPGLEELGLALSPAALMNLYTTFWASETAALGV